MDVLIGEAEELDTVGLLLQPVQLETAGCIVYDKCCFFSNCNYCIASMVVFFLQSVSIYVYNSGWKEFHVETCKHVNPIK